MITENDLPVLRQTQEFYINPDTLLELDAHIEPEDMLVHGTPQGTWELRKPMPSEVGKSVEAYLTDYLSMGLKAWAFREPPPTIKEQILNWIFSLRVFPPAALFAYLAAMAGWNPVLIVLVGIFFVLYFNFFT